MKVPYSALEKAISLFDKGNYNEAIVEFKKLLELDKRLQPAYYYLGMSFLNKGLADEAISIWKIGMKKFHPWKNLEDNIRMAYDRAGWINYKNGKKDKAIECFENSIRQNVNYLKTHSDINNKEKFSLIHPFANSCKYLGIMYIEKGLPHRAIPFLEKAKELDTSISGVKTRLKKALQFCKREAEVDPILDIIPNMPQLDSTVTATSMALRDESLRVRPRDWKDPYQGFARKYSKSPYYQQEAEILEPFWTQAFSDVLRKANEKYRWHCWAYITNEITRDMPHEKLKRLKILCEKSGITWYNAIMRFAMAKREQLKLAYQKPKIKSCKHCHHKFFEANIQTSLFDYLIKATKEIDYCQKCLSAAFYGAYKTKKNIDTLKQDLANLVSALGFIPPKKIFQNKNFVEAFPKGKLNQIIPALVEISHPEVYEKKFGSWLKALIDSGTLNENARRLIFGTLCIAEDGHECKSLAEKTIDDWLYQNNVPHITEPFYPRDKNLNPDGLMKADWQVGNSFIEYFGLIGIEEYEEKIDEKRELCQRYGIDLVEITQEDLYDLDAKLKVVMRGRQLKKRMQSKGNLGKSVF